MFGLGLSRSLAGVDRLPVEAGFRSHARPGLGSWIARGWPPVVILLAECCDAQTERRLSPFATAVPVASPHTAFTEINIELVHVPHLWN